jgi:hypothetical protein
MTPPIFSKIDSAFSIFVLESLRTSGKESTYRKGRLKSLNTQNRREATVSSEVEIVESSESDLLSFPVVVAHGSADTVATRVES